MQLEVLASWLSRLFHDGQLSDYCAVLEDVQQVTSVTALLAVRVVPRPRGPAGAAGWLAPRAALWAAPQRA